MNLTTTTQVDPAVGIFYDRVLLKRAVPALVHDRFAQKKGIKSKSGTTIKFRRYNSLTVAKTPLQEGVTPPGQQLSKTDLTAQVSQYGDFVHVTDVVDLTVEDAVLTETAILLGEQMGETLDEITRDILAACASVTNASGGFNGDTPTEITQDDVDAVVDTLLGGNAKFISNIIKAGTGVGTAPVRAAYWGIFDTDIRRDVEDCEDWLGAHQYPNQSDIQADEWGSTGNVRWLMTTKGYYTDDTSNLGADTYYLPIFGKDAYGTIKLDGGTVQNIVKEFGSGGTSDPLNQRATSGWKAWWVARILNDAFMHILKVTKNV